MNIDVSQHSREHWSALLLLWFRCGRSLRFLTVSNPLMPGHVLQQIGRIQSNVDSLCLWMKSFGIGLILWASTENVLYIQHCAALYYRQNLQIVVHVANHGILKQLSLIFRKKSRRWFGFRHINLVTGHWPKYVFYRYSRDLTTLCGSCVCKWNHDDITFWTRSFILIVTAAVLWHID